jgi:hypothetical protein
MPEDLPDRQKGAPAAGPATLNFSFMRPWSVIQPRVYRFLEAEYVDAFFENGSLMLSSFSRFASHADEQRGDAMEGKGVRVVTGKDCTLVMASGRGDDCYILCGATTNTAGVRSCFPYANAAFVIDNPLEFANMVSSCIPRFKGGVSGHCIYQDDPTIRRHDEDLTLEEIQPKTLDDLPRVMERAGGIEELFIKRSKFASQAEYRFAWASAGPIEDKIVVTCPEARQYCRRI